MIEIQHDMELVFVLDKAHFLGMCLKLFQIHVINVLSYQSFNNLFEIEPPKRQSKKIYNKLQPR